MHVWFLYLDYVLSRDISVYSVCVIYTYIHYIALHGFTLHYITYHKWRFPLGIYVWSKKAAGIVCHPHYESSELRERCFWAEKLHGHRSRAVKLMNFCVLFFVFEIHWNPSHINMKRLYSFSCCQMKINSFWMVCLRDFSMSFRCCDQYLDHETEFFLPINGETVTINTKRFCLL